MLLRTEDLATGVLRFVNCDTIRTKELTQPDVSAWPISMQDSSPSSRSPAQVDDGGGRDAAKPLKAGLDEQPSQARRRPPAPCNDAITVGVWQQAHLVPDGYRTRLPWPALKGFTFNPRSKDWTANCTRSSPTKKCGRLHCTRMGDGIRPDRSFR